MNDDMFEFKHTIGDADISIRIYQNGVPFDELVERFKEFALACGYQPETIRAYFREYGG